MRVSGAPEGINLSNVPPGERTDYWYAADPKLVTFEGATVYYSDDGTCFDGGIRYGARRTIHPGEQIDETWNKAPEVPASAALPDVGVGLRRTQRPNRPRSRRLPRRPARTTTACSIWSAAATPTPATCAQPLCRRTR